MEYWKKEQVLKELKITERQLKRFRDLCAVAYVKFKGYDIEQLCSYIVSKPKLRKDRSKARENAEKILTKFFKKKPAADTPEAPVKATAKSNYSHIRKDLHPGLQAALERARTAEVELYKLHADYLKERGNFNASFFDGWQRSIDNLRKCEGDVVKILREQNELIQLKAVEDWLESKLEQLKIILLNLPSKLAPILESLTWQEIQKRLEQEIRDAIEKVGKIGESVDGSSETARKAKPVALG